MTEKKKAILGVQGMTCVSCSLTLTSALKDVEGVSAADVDFNQRKAVVEFDPAKTDEQRLLRAVKEAGYSASPFEAPEEAGEKPPAASFASSASGLLATLGSSFQLCHNLCLALMALLASVGILYVGFPFLFLVDYGIYFWGFALLLLVPSVAMRWKNPHCGSGQVLLFNVGVIVAGTPPQFTFGFQPLFWGVGGVVAGTGIARWALERLKRRNPGKRACH